MFNNMLLKSISISALALALASGHAYSGDAVKNLPVESIDGSGRNIMRTVDGGLVSAYAVANGSRKELVFSTSLDNGQHWNATTINGTNGKVVQVAVDSNFEGSYLAFTEKENRLSVGKVAFVSAPFADKPAIVVSQVITPPGVDASDTFIQASRRGWGNHSDESRQTIVYGWQDKNSKNLYVGVSTDGRTFPMASKVVEDKFATSGPAVAIRGDDVIASYLTTNPAFAPVDVDQSTNSGRAYPAYIESLDGGRTWSKPKALFGLKAADYPVVKVEFEPGKFEDLRLAGGTNQPNSPTLDWGSTRELGPRDVESDKSASTIDPSLDPNNGINFVQTSMQAVDKEGRPIGEVGIVSFKAIKPPNAPWKHVVANNKLSNSVKDLGASKPDVTTSYFQYSALINTPIRATSYKEYDKTTGSARLVVAVSTDTGMNFEHHISFTPEELSRQGIKAFDEKAIFTSSQCLFEDRNGDVYLDVLVSQGIETHYARVPVGVNAGLYRVAGKM